MSCTDDNFVVKSRNLSNMPFTTLAITAAAAVAVAPAVLAQTATPPISVVSFDSCAEKLGAGGSHSLMDILDGQFSTNYLQGEDSALEPLVAAASPETLELLMDFDVDGRGYTLMMPFNMDKMGNALSEEYAINSTAFTLEADEILMAHILPGTLGYGTLEEATAGNGTYPVKSLQGFEWTFGWSMGEEGGFPFVVDEWNVTKEGTIKIQTDIHYEPDWYAPTSRI